VLTIILATINYLVVFVWLIIYSKNFLIIDKEEGFL